MSTATTIPELEAAADAAYEVLARAKRRRQVVEIETARWDYHCAVDVLTDALILERMAAK